MCWIGTRRETRGWVEKKREKLGEVDENRKRKGSDVKDTEGAHFLETHGSQKQYTASRDRTAITGTNGQERNVALSVRGERSQEASSVGEGNNELSVCTRASKSNQLK